MARKLKTYQTSLGFFDLAIAAPSMKAALEAWESGNNLFHQGFAKETTDPAIVKATMDKPGVVLRRPVGTDGAFTEHAELPGNFPTGTHNKSPKRHSPRVQEKRGQENGKKPAHHVDPASDKVQERLNAERRQADAAREREARRRSQVIAKLEATLDNINEDHRRTIAEIERERAALDKRQQEEGIRWAKQKEHIESKIRQARE